MNIVSSSSPAGKRSFFREILDLRPGAVNPAPVSDQDQIEHVLREAVRVLHETQSMAKVGSYVLDIPSGVWESSSVLDELFGIDKDYEHSADSWLAIVHPEERSTMSEHLSQEVFKDRVPFDKTYRIVRVDDGVERWVHGLGKLETDASGKPLNLFGTIQDVTERKLVEIALRDSATRFRDLVEMLPFAVFQADEQGLCTYVNRAWRELTGLTMKQALGDGWRQAVCEQDRARVIGMWTESKQPGGQWSDEYRFCTPDGTIRWVFGQVAAIYGTGGKIDGYLGTNCDISEKIDAESALRQKEVIVASSSDMLALLDTDYTYLDTNQAYLKRLGCERDQVVGHTVAHVLGMQVFTKTVKPNADRCMKGVAVNYQEWFEFPVTGRTYMDIHYYPYEGTDGSVKGFVVNGRDITERKRSEEAIHALTLDLERRVIERTEGLETANKKLENFSYAVAHDLKAPLRAIDAYSSMLAEELSKDLNPETERLLAVVRQKAQHMGGLIDDLLAFSGLGRAELKIVGVDMSEMARSVFEELASQHPDRDIKLTLHDLPVVHADFALMQQVWENLLDNAIKFTGNRMITQIEIGSRLEANHYVFFVKDNGAGFKSEYGDKLFRVFHRLHHEDEFPGTGVGLANVRQIVERHGGETWAEGEVDQGATFFFRLPRVGGLA